MGRRGGEESWGREDMVWGREAAAVAWAVYIHVWWIKNQDT